MSERFMELLRAGSVSPAEIDDFVARWHEEDSDLTLHEFLGLSEEEYSTWVERGVLPGATKKSRVVDVTTTCVSFPAVEPAEVGRDNFLVAIDRFFEAGIQAIVLEGEEGVGKTTISSQYARRFPDRAIGLFVRPTSAFAYDPRVLLFDLCNQLSWILDGAGVHEHVVVDESLFQRLVFKLWRRAEAERRPFTFILDGLSSLPADGMTVRDQLLALLPLGQAHFRFVLTAERADQFNEISSRVAIKTLPILGFTPEETKDFFGKTDLEPGIVAELHKVAGGHPGHLASIRRSIASGVPSESITARRSTAIDDLLALEWGAAVPLADTERKLLALLAFEPNHYPVEELAAIASLSVSDAIDALGRFHFVTIEETANSRVARFVSEGMRTFAAKRLSAEKHWAHDAFIDFLSRTPEADRALSLLPSQYAAAGRLDELVRYLSSERLMEIIRTNESLAPVIQKVELGMKVCREQRRDPDLVRFGMQRSAVALIDRSDLLRREIAARMSLGDYEGSLGRAESCLLKLERLETLAVIAKKQKQAGGSPEQIVMQQIDTLAQQVPEDCEDSRRFELAGTLMHTRPDLALKIVRDAKQGERKADDWALASLASRTLAESLTEGAFASEAIEAMRSQITDPAARRFAAAMSVTVRDLSFADLQAEVHRIKETADRVHLYRQWTLQAVDKNADSYRVVKSALDEVIRETKYTVTAADLRELSVPLPSIFQSNKEQGIELLAMFDAQKSTAARTGPSEDYVRFLLQLAEAEWTFDRGVAGNRLLDAYFFADALPELAIRLTCLAHFHSELLRIDPSLELEKQHGIHAQVEADLDKGIDRLLLETADHHKVTRRILSALSLRCAPKALAVISKLNTEQRREMALIDFCGRHVEQRLERLDFTALVTAFSRFVAPWTRDHAIGHLFERLVQIRKAATIAQHIISLKSVSELVSSVRGPATRAKSRATIIKVFSLHSTPECEPLVDGARIEILKDLRQIEDPWERVALGYEIVEMLAASLPALANDVMRHTEDVRAALGFDDSSVDDAYVYSSRLMLRSFAGLLPRRLVTHHDFDLVGDRIGRIASLERQVEVWSDLAQWCFCSNSHDEGVSVVSNRIRPLLDQIFEPDVWEVAVEAAAPALYRANALGCFELLSRAHPWTRSSAISNITRFLLWRHPVSDPHDSGPEPIYKINNDEALELCELLSRIEVDSTLYAGMATVVSSVLESSNKIAKTQRAEIARRLSDVAAKAFPNKRFINHDGYVIASAAQIARLERAKPDKWWDELLERARMIPNLADRAFVIAIVAGSRRSGGATWLRKAFEESQGLVEKLPVVSERISRLEHVSSEAMKADQPFARQLLRLAMTSVVALPKDADFDDSAARDLVDKANEFDPKLAQELAAMLDNDEARRGARRAVDEGVSVNEIKKALIEDPEAVESNPKFLRANADAAWLALAALNGGRANARPLKDFAGIVQIAARNPIDESYPVLALVIENARRRFSGTEGAATILRDLYEISSKSCDLIAAVGRKNARKQSILESGEASRSKIVRTKEAGAELLDSWLGASAVDYLKICDPFFGLDELSLLLRVQALNPGIRSISILTSRKVIEEAKVQQPWNESFRAHWWSRVSATKPPETEVLIIGTSDSNKFPIHDRWWVSKGSGLKLGTSLSGMGNRASDFAPMDRTESLEKEALIDQYLSRQVRVFDGERLDYVIFAL